MPRYHNTSVTNLISQQITVNFITHILHPFIELQHHIFNRVHSIHSSKLYRVFVLFSLALAVLFLGAYME
jgi:hypothetical protein